MKPVSALRISDFGLPFDPSTHSGSPLVRPTRREPLGRTRGSRRGAWSRGDGLRAVSMVERLRAARGRGAAFQGETPPLRSGRHPATPARHASGPVVSYYRAGTQGGRSLLLLCVLSVVWLCVVGRLPAVARRAEEGSPNPPFACLAPFAVKTRWDNALRVAAAVSLSNARFFRPKRLTCVRGKLCT
jgi:hypothetical protein